MSNDINQDIAKELVAQTAGKTYDDLAHPAAQATGQILSFIPRTIRLWFGKWENWIINGEHTIQKTQLLLNEKLKDIPEEKIVEPEPYVAIPAIQQLSYSFDSEELRELYANLLASSMNVDTKYDVHPAFVDIIKQLTPDEAKLLKILPRTSISYEPLIDLQLNMGAKRGHFAMLRNYTNIGEGVCDVPENICSYIDNLDRLKLIRVLDDIHVMESEKYVPIETNEFLVSIKNKLSIVDGRTVTIKRKSFYVTEFGLSFINTCVT